MADILAKLGIGTFTTKDGQVVSFDSLPPEIQAAIKPMAGLRDLAQMSGNEELEAREQKKINDLYNPATRDAIMSQRAGEQVVRALSDRMNRR